MARLDALPVELILRILHHLPLQSICALQLTSRFWTLFVKTNETAVYHAAAVRHGFVRAEQRLSDAVLMKENRFMHHVKSWKKFCYNRFQLHRNWAGQGSVMIDTLLKAERDVHRIKIDEARGLLIATHRSGGLSVVDKVTGRVLWGLTKSYVRRYAHLEYEDGFMIYDRYNGNKEVWRHIEDFDLFPPPKNNHPDSAQRAASEARCFGEDRRGRFKAWALLLMPEMTRAYRFAYPTLAVASANSVFLWDISSATLLQTIPDTSGLRGGDSFLGDVLYIDVSAEHVFLCGILETRIFSRADNSLILRIHATQTYSPRSKVVLEQPGSDDSGDLVVPIRSHIVTANAEPSTSYDLPFTAIHVSRSGRDIAALAVDDRLVILRDFERVAKGQISYADAALEIQLRPFSGSPSRPKSIYLSFEYGRVGVVTTSGVYIITLDAAGCGLFDPDVHPPLRDTTLGIVHDHVLFPPDVSFTHLAASYIPFFSKPEVLSHVSCLQMTATQLYMTWNPRYMPPRKRVIRAFGHHVDSTAQTTGQSQGVEGMGVRARVALRDNHGAATVSSDFDAPTDDEEEEEAVHGEEDEEDEEWGDADGPQHAAFVALLERTRADDHVVCRIDLTPHAEE